MVRALLLALMTGLAATDAEIGKTVPEWEWRNWINSKPLKLSDLRGKVVLVRWWTAPACEYCANCAPALNEFHREYTKRGLQVVSAYLRFPVAIDPDWRSLERWRKDHHETSFTSLTFLIDRQGILRYVHPGGEYIQGDRDYKEIKQRIEALLSPK